MPALRLLASAALLAALPAALHAQDPDRTEPRRTGPSILSGRVIDHESGRPVEDAVVSLAPADGGGREAGTRRSGEDGTFLFEDVAPGGYTLAVSSLSYRTTEDPLDVEPGSHVRVVVRLSAEPLELEPLVVVTARRPAFMEGFEERRSRARRHTAFFTREEIEERDPLNLTELFRGTPGVDVLQSHLGDRVLVEGSPTGGPPCPPEVWVDGRHVELLGMSYSDLYPPGDIAAIELYAHERDVPERFRSGDRCGALVIWLRERGPERRLPSWWKRGLVALAVLGGLILLGG